MPGLPTSTDRPEVEVRIGGRPAEPRLADDVVEVDVTEEVDRHGRCVLLVQNWDPDKREVRWSDDGPLVPGAELEVSLGYHSTLATVFAGVVTAVTGHFTGDQAPTLRVEARSRSVLLAGPARSRVLEETTDGDLVAALAADYGLRADTEDGADRAVAVLDRERPWPHLVARAEALGWVTYVRDRTLVFRPPVAPAGTPVELTWTKDVVELHVTQDVGALPSSSSAAGWDADQQAAVVSAAASATGGLGTGERRDHAATVGDLGWPQREETEAGPAVGTSAETDLLATARARTAELRHVTGSARLVGNPALRCDSWVTVRGTGRRLGGPLYVASVRHRLGRSGFTTELGLGRPARLAPADPAPPSRTLVVGVVTDLADTEKQARVKVAYPWAGATEAVWARLATPYAGKEQGLYAVPDLDQEVLVGFLDGSVDDPVVLGSLWSATFAPPFQPGEENAVRALRTASGHELVFTEGDDGSVVLRTAGGHVLTLAEEDSTVTLEAASGNRITLSDDGIELSAAKGDLTLKAPSGAVEIQAMSIKGKADGTASLEASATFDIKASATLGLRGAMVNIN
ncbi:phage baseplate assembly protein V [Nocardioides sp. cx-169]|uniref:phage baseplate assembly protein V n=1 Tax=Nocardioides sp. cx-169 TaxID=2899080 RepID=UPI001E34694B|nr:phage baseplate assembly protein V [Nocardioides sp. cx-169]MCD4536376.1 phage baseplate assembly protein V [Nocardioides sp. cx-169]